MKSTFLLSIITSFCFTTFLVFGQPGNADASFITNCGSGTNGAIYNLAIQSDGKIILGGNFTNYNAFADGNIDRILPSGGIDGNFVVGTGCNSWVNAITVLSDGKIDVAGDFSTLQGFPALFLGILYNDGSFDIGNNIGTGPNNIIRGITKTNDRAIIFGDFTSYDGNSIQNCAKIYLDGTLDPTFSPGLGFNNVIYDVQIQSDGKLIAGGAFTSYDGFSSQRITRMNSNGSLDLKFNPGSGFNGIPYDVKIDSDGNILVVGEFTEYNSTLVGHLVKLNGSAVLLDEFEKIETSHLYPNPCSTNFSINTSDYIEEVNIYNSLGQLIYSGKSSSIDLKEPEAGIYFVRIKTNKNLWTEKLEVN